jgi:hypothetical protein
MSLEAEIGPIRYTLDVPALDEAGYARLQRSVMAPILAPRRRPLWNIAIVLVASAAIGGLGGYLASSWSLDAQMWIGNLETGEGWELGGSDIFLATIGLILFSFLLAILLIRLNQRRALRRLHRASGGILAAQRLHFGDHGILSRNEGRAELLLWPRVTGLVPARGYLFILIDQASAFWLPEELLASLPDRDGFLRFLRAQIGQPSRIEQPG